MDKRIKRLEEIRIELGDIANSYAGDKTGIAAATLHSAAGRISDAERMITKGTTYEDKLRMANEWCDRQSISMNQTMRQAVIQLMTQ